MEIGNSKRNEIYSKLNNLNLNHAANTELLDNMEVINDKSNQLEIVLNDLTNIMNELSTKVNQKTDEINTINRISDTRLKLKKNKIVVNQLANELDLISDKYEVYIPDFKEHYVELVNSFIYLYANYEQYMSEADKGVKNDLINSIDSAIESLTDLLVTMDGLPKFTSKYGEAHIRLMKLLKELVDELLFGRELMDQIE